MIPNDLVRVLESVPEKRLALLRMAWELVGENGEGLIIRYISEEGRDTLAELMQGPARGLQRFFLQRILRDGRLKGAVAD